MDTLTVEQKLYGSTYRPSEQAAKATAALGEFAFSFEELLQRVGARINQAFSAADSSSGLLNASSDTRVDTVPRESDRNTGSSEDGDRPDDSKNAHTDNHNPVANDSRDTGTDRSYDADDSDTSTHTSRRADSRDQDRQTANSSERDSASSDTPGRDGKDAGANKADAGDSNTTEQPIASNASQDATQSATAATAGQGAALYAAGVVANIASTNAKSGNTQQGQQAQAVKEGVQGVTAQVAANAAGKTKGRVGTDEKAQPTNRANNHQGNATAQNGQQQLAAAKVGDVQQITKPDSAQDQAQRLASMLNKGTHAEIKVSVTSDQNQITSKPMTSLTNGSIIANDGNGNAANGDNQQNGQRQGTNSGQNTQQMQLAASNQPAQVAPKQNTYQGGQQGGPAQISSGPSATQAGANVAHNTGGTDTISNTQSNAATQSTQQTQQTRDAQPQNQAQQAQRNSLLSSNVADQISVKISKALQAGTDRISIQLRPAELGRVDVKMEMTHDGRVMTVVTAERQDTLDLLRRDSSELQRALAEAGLQSGDMEFNLKGQEQQSAKGDEGSGKSDPLDIALEDELPQEESAVMNAWESGIFMNGRIDLRA